MTPKGEPSDPQPSSGIEAHSGSRSDVTTAMPQLDSDTNKRTYNILLIGETGVGKSTFINAFYYYLTYESLSDALNADDITALVPTRFTIFDEDFNETEIVFGKDENESIIPGSSATQSPRSYKFYVGNSIIRLIDTPGVGDTRGLNTDEQNFDRLLATIGELENIHAICIMLKPNNARLTVLFEYCVKQMLSRLQRSASQNIVFLFTNSRSTLYRPGDTAVPLRKILKAISERPPNVSIPFGKENIFSIDNEAFRFLIANKQGVRFSDEDRDDFAGSWNRSSKVCLSLVNYITRIAPHKIQDTVSINEARRLILRLSRPLAEITDNIDKNIEIIKRHKAKLNDRDKTIEDLKKKLYIPVLRLKAIDLEYPRTVCNDSSCIDIIRIDGSTKTQKYRTICHDHCYLKTIEPKLVGDPGLIHCDAMVGQHCRRCGHHFTVHLHITYDSETYEEKIKDAQVVSVIESTESDVQNLQNTIENLEARKSKYESERIIIQKSTAKFAHFLTNNAITVYNDKYKEYINLLIDRENSLGEARDKETIQRYHELLQTYEEEKKILDDILEQQKLTDSSRIAAVTAEEVMETVEKLYTLELTGTTVKNFYDAQHNVLKHELLTSTEKTYTPPESILSLLKRRISSLFSML